MSDAPSPLPVLPVPSADEQLDTIRRLRHMSGPKDRPLLLRYAHLGPDRLAAFMIPLWRLPEDTPDKEFPTECMEVTGRHLSEGTFRTLIAVLVIAQNLVELRKKTMEVTLEEALPGSDGSAGDLLTQGGTVQDIKQILHHAQTERVSFEDILLERETPAEQEQTPGSENTDGERLTALDDRPLLDVDMVGTDASERTILDVDLRLEAALGTPYAELYDPGESKEDTSTRDETNSDSKKKGPAEWKLKWGMVGAGFDTPESGEQPESGDWEWISHQNALPDWLQEMCRWASDAWEDPDTGTLFWSKEMLRDLLTAVFEARAKARSSYTEQMDQESPLNGAAPSAASGPATDSMSEEQDSTASVSESTEPDEAKTAPRPDWDDRWMAWPPLVEDEGGTDSFDMMEVGEEVNAKMNKEDQRTINKEDPCTTYLKRLRSAMMVWVHRTVGREILQPWLTTAWHIWPDHDQRPTNVLIEPQGLLHILPLETAPVAWPWKTPPNLETFVYPDGEDNEEEESDEQKTASQTETRETKTHESDEGTPAGGMPPEDRSSQSITQHGAVQNGDKHPLVHHVAAQRVPSTMLIPHVMDLDASGSSASSAMSGKQPRPKTEKGSPLNGASPIGDGRSIVAGPPSNIKTGETAAVREILSKQGRTCVRLETPDMNRDQLLRLLSPGETRLVHIVAHGRYNARSPLDSRLQGTGGVLLSARDLINGTIDLTGVRLVYLSSCWGGHGEADYNDEVMGLVHGVLSAGAACVVGHLYPVDSALAEEMAVAFHEYFIAEGATARKAYRAAVEAAVEASQEEAGEDRLLGTVADWTGYTLYGNPSVRYEG